MIPRFFMLYILLNIFRILMNLFETLIPFFLKNIGYSHGNTTHRCCGIEQLVFFCVHASGLSIAPSSGSHCRCFFRVHVILYCLHA